jgi:hypothetical protein
MTVVGTVILLSAEVQSCPARAFSKRAYPPLVIDGSIKLLFKTQALLQGLSKRLGVGSAQFSTV